MALFACISDFPVSCRGWSALSAPHTQPLHPAAAFLVSIALYRSAAALSCCARRLQQRPIVKACDRHRETVTIGTKRHRYAGLARRWMSLYARPTLRLDFSDSVRTGGDVSYAGDNLLGSTDSRDDRIGCGSTPPNSSDRALPARSGGVPSTEGRDWSRMGDRRLK